MTIDQQIGSNIHTLLWARRMRQAQLCDVLGITRQSLHRKMRGEQPWSAKEVQEAADALGVRPGALYESRELLHGSDPTPQDRVTRRYHGTVADLGAYRAAKAAA